MASGGYRPGSGRPRTKVVAKAKKCASSSVKSSPDMTPLDYMLAVMRDEAADEARRDRMAIAAAPFLHGKASDKKLGKKEQQEQNARDSKDVFSGTRSMPKLVVDNR